MSDPSDDDLETSLRSAFGNRRDVTFDEWCAGHSDALAQMGRRPHALVPIWRTQIMKWSAAAVAMVVISATLSIFLRSASTEKVFAQALEQATNAKTFSADELTTYKEDGQQKSWEQRVMFKEPHLERWEDLQNHEVVEVTIIDYGTRQQLQLDPVNKTASFADLNTSFEVDPATGKLKLSQLHTGLRDQLLSLQSRAVEDLGNVELAGKTVRLMQSQREGRVVKVWSDPQSKQPRQISIEFPDQSTLYSSIKINEELPDELFRLTPPEGYRLLPHSMPTPRVGRLFATMKFLLLECVNYASGHDHQFPNQLNDVDLNKDVLKELLSNIDVKLEYVRPPSDANPAQAIVLYEAHDKWPDGGVVAGFADGHVEYIQDEQRFKNLLHPPQ